MGEGEAKITSNDINQELCKPWRRHSDCNRVAIDGINGDNVIKSEWHRRRHVSGLAGCLIGSTVGPISDGKQTNELFTTRRGKQTAARHRSQSTKISSERAQISRFESRKFCWKSLGAPKSCLSLLVVLIVLFAAHGETNALQNNDTNAYPTSHHTITTPSITKHQINTVNDQTNAATHHDSTPIDTNNNHNSIVLNASSTIAPTLTTSSDAFLLPNSTSTSTSVVNNNPNITIDTSVNHEEATSKLLKNINFTQVDELFHAVLTNSELVGRWRLMDTQIQDGVKGILKMIFPQIIAISQDAKVSGECSGAILKWILSLRNLRSWAIKMLDASGKPASGIFQGSLSMLGNYRQCLAVRAPDEDEIEITDQFEEYFRGRYCVLHMRPWLPEMPAYYNLNATIEPLLRKSYKYYEKTLYDDLAEIASAFNFVHIRMDLCIPSNCNEADIQRVADLMAKKMEMRAKVMRCDTESREPWWTQLDSISISWMIATMLLTCLPLILTIIRRLFEWLIDNQAVKGCSSMRECLRCLSLGAIIDDRLLLKSGQAPPLNGTIFPKILQPIGDLSSVKHGQKHHQEQNISTVNSDLDTKHHSSDAERPKCSNEPASFMEQTPVTTCKDANSATGNVYSANVSETSFEVAPSLSESLKSNNIESQQQQTLSATMTITSTTTGRLYQLQSVRIVLIIWFIIIQLSADLNYQYIRESLLLRDLLFNYWPFQLIINTTMLFESFILLTAFTFSYNCLGWSTYKILAYFMRKYTRLVLPLIAVICLTILLPVANIESPIWRNLVDQQASLCKTNGFIDLLMLQNFIPFDKMCLPHTWVICVEFQLALLSIPLLLLIEKTIKHKLASTISSANKSDSNQAISLSSSVLVYKIFFKSTAGLIGFQLVIFGALTNFMIVYTNHLPPAWFSTFPDAGDKNSYFSHYLTKPWAHMSTFVIGIFAGSLAKCLVEQRKFIASLQGRDHGRLMDQLVDSQSSPSPSCLSSSQSFVDRSQSSSTINETSNGSTTFLTMSNTNIYNGNNAKTTSIITTTNITDRKWRDHETKKDKQSSTSGNESQTERHMNCLTKFSHIRNCVRSIILNVMPLTVMLIIIYATFKWSTEKLPDNLMSGIYDSGSRILWSSCLSMLLIRWTTTEEVVHVANNHNDDRSINITTGQSVCIVLGRLSLIAFLVSPLINNLLLAVQEQAIFSSIFIMFHLIIGNTLIIFSVSFMLAILIEQPLTRLVGRVIAMIPVERIEQPISAKRTQTG